MEDEQRKGAGHSEESGDTDADVEGHKKHLDRAEAGAKTESSDDDSPDVEGHRHEASRHEASRHEANRKEQ